MFRPLFLVFLVSPILASVPSSQDLKSIEGKVVDAKGKAIPAAPVRLLSKDPGPPLETLTEIDGTFSFPNLPAGSYQVSVEMAGFQKLALEGIDPSTEAGRQLNLVLKRPEAPRVPGPESPRRGAERRNGGDDSHGFREADLRDPSDLDSPRSAASGAADESGAAPSPEDNSDLLVISGRSTASLGAGDWNDPQFQERLREMVNRMGFGGEGGGFAPGGRFEGGSGGGRRSGGRRSGSRLGRVGGGRRQSPLNGSVTSNYRNSLFNARPYSITGAEVSKPLQIQNEFGFSIGGPLPWGSQAKGNRPMQQPGMWFFSYEGSRNRDPFDVLTTVPTELERQGDFSETSLRAGPLAGQKVVLLNPFAAAPAPFPDGRIPATRMNSAALALLKYIPLPNLQGSVQNFTMQRGLMNTSDSFLARVNTRLSAKDRVHFNYSRRSGELISSRAFPGLDTKRTNRAQYLGAGGVHQFSPSFILNYRVKLNRVRNESTNPFTYVDDVEGRLGIQGVSREPINFGIPNINFTNYGDLQLASPALNRSQTLTAGGGLSRIGNRHSIEAGGDIAWNRRDNRIDTDARGIFEFTGFATSAFDSNGHPRAGTGYDLADFLLGLPYSTARRYGSSDTSLRSKSFSLFVQDNWRVRANVNLYIGLRYEYIQPFCEKHNRIVGLDVAPGFTAVAQVFPDQAGPYTGLFPRSLVFGDKNNLGPHIGIAVKPKANSRWVFRAGYGLFYVPTDYRYVYRQLVGQPPFAISQNILTTLSNPLTLQNGFPTEPEVTILNTYAVDPFYRIGYVQQFNFNIYTQFFKLYTLDFGYNGSMGTRLDILRAPNRAPRGVSPGSTEDNRVIANAGNFVYQSSGANSVLHSLSVRLSRPFSHGFSTENSYTLGKSIDNASGIGGENLVVVQDESNIRAERSRSSFDQRHRFKSEFSFDLPFGERRRFFSGAAGLANQIISGWKLNGSYNFNSGTPLTARILGNISNNSGTGSNSSERPDSTGASPSLRGGQRTTLAFFNTDAFAFPAPGKFGNAGRYTIQGPGSNLLNLSLRKTFRLDDNGRRLEFRWRATNVLNHPNYAGVGTVVNSLAFGRVTEARSMRQMEFELRINY